MDERTDVARQEYTEKYSNISQKILFMHWLCVPSSNTWKENKWPWHQTQKFKMKTSIIIVTTNSAAWCRDNHSLVIGITNHSGSRSVL